MAITEDTKFRLKAATIVGLILATAGAVWQVQTILTEIRDSVVKVSDRITSLESATDTKMRTLENVIADRFTLAAAAEWSLRLKVANPEIRVPDPRNPSELIGN